MYFASMLQINSTLEKLDLGDCDLVSKPVKLSAVTQVTVRVSVTKILQCLLRGSALCCHWVCIFWWLEVTQCIIMQCVLGKVCCIKLWSHNQWYIRVTVPGNSGAWLSHIPALFLLFIFCYAKPCVIHTEEGGSSKACSAIKPESHPPHSSVAPVRARLIKDLGVAVLNWVGRPLIWSQIICCLQGGRWDSPELPWEGQEGRNGSRH